MSHAKKISNDFAPGPELYVRVRQGFVGQDSSLNRWCIENGVNRHSAMSCLKGVWNGPKGRALRQKIIEASGISN
ncbi:hypothetical protein [Endozoicomonas numazuensis]|uniref:Uncharacterized protein n=1 Tax=Endozoicomonas numazuensis TaxID=1137799 RepID=A0A081NL77_9GAMM|nr:hypothetical protein [Endozoicomonas numazuensis]KEQ19200.1 hypothetical protein GZ78_04180 [Endozoicomonas numazuensis]